MPHTDQLVTIVDYVKAKMETNAVALGLVDVYYGDQNLIPQTPAVAVEGLAKVRNLREGTTSHRTFNTFRVLLMVYLSRLDNNETTQRDVELKAEAIEALLHDDVTMGGNVIHGFVTDIEPGRAMRSNVLLRAARMVWQGQTLTRL